MKNKLCVIISMSLFFPMLFMIGCDLFQDETAEAKTKNSQVAAAKISQSDDCAAVIAKFEGVDKQSEEGKALIEEYYKVCGDEKKEKAVSEECAAVIAKFKGVDKESEEGKALIKEYYNVCEGKTAETSK